MNSDRHFVERGLGHFSGLEFTQYLETCFCYSPNDTILESV